MNWTFLGSGSRFQACKSTSKMSGKEPKCLQKFCSECVSERLAEAKVTDWVRQYLGECERSAEVKDCRGGSVRVWKHLGECRSTWWGAEKLRWVQKYLDKSRCPLVRCGSTWMKEGKAWQLCTDGLGDHTPVGRRCIRCLLKNSSWGVAILPGDIMSLPILFWAKKTRKQENNFSGGVSWCLNAIPSYWDTCSLKLEFIISLAYLDCLHRWAPMVKKNYWLDLYR
jgi:hypothetical protein